jgi:hypothetical protein
MGLQIHHGYVENEAGDWDVFALSK